MRSRSSFLTLLSLLSLSIGPAAQAQIKKATPVLRSCQQSVGNASLGVGGLPQVGGLMRVELRGEPLKPFLLLIDDEDFGFTFAGVRACVGPDALALANGFANPHFVMPPTGTFQMDLPIPDDPLLAGQTFFVQGLISDLSSPNGVLAVSNQVAFTLQAPGKVETVFFEDFEAGQGTWAATNGLWQVGGLCSGTGPASPYSGGQCAGTVLCGQYPHTGADSTLVSPYFQLPEVAAGEQLRLNYRVWFSSEDGYDWMRPRISVNGAAFVDLPDAVVMSGWSGVWSQATADLTAFAGEYVRIGFRFQSNYTIYNGNVAGPGFYVDDIHVFRGTPFVGLPEDWEKGIGDWWTVQNGLWEVGVPTAGPVSTPSGEKCAGTVLAGNYPHTGANTRLVSGPIQLQASPPPTLYFNHWFSTEVGYDFGLVQVSTDGGKTFTTVSPQPVTGQSGGWTPGYADLAAYAGQEVRIAFYFESNYTIYNGNQNGPGWYIDDIDIK